jgi:hypothetical protein
MRTLLVALLLVACGKNLQQPPIDAPKGGPDAALDAYIPPGWTDLISRTWSLTPGATNVYMCRRIQVPTDMWINAFRSLSPTGTHHAVITIDPSDTATGDYNCDPGAGVLNGQMIYASGLMTDDLVFPTGVAVHLAAGTWINLNLHLFDVSDQPISGESGLLVQTVPQASVVHEADMTFSGKVNFSIPATGQPYMVSGGCAAPTDWHVFSLWPHMHQIGTHQTLTVTHNGVTTTPLDVPFMFTEQKNYPMAEQIYYQGDQITTTCTYVNNTGAVVPFGQSSTQEMCFTGLYKYPAGSTTLGCVS